MNDDDKRVRVIIHEEGSVVLGDFDFLRVPCVDETIVASDGEVFVVTLVIHDVEHHLTAGRCATVLMVQRAPRDPELDRRFGEIQKSYDRFPDEHSS